jgi:hypothetical protein
MKLAVSLRCLLGFVAFVTYVGVLSVPEFAVVNATPASAAKTILDKACLLNVSEGTDRYTGRRIIILMADLDVRVITEDGELIRHFTLNPSKDYQPRRDD